MVQVISKNLWRVFRRDISRKQPEAYSEPSQTSKMEFFSKIVDDLQLVWEGSKYAFGNYWLPAKI